VGLVWRLIPTFYIFCWCSPIFKKNGTEIQEKVVIIQCDSGHLYGDLIACARYRVCDLMAKGDQEQRTHVLFIIHLPRQLSCSLVGFQGDPWISCHIDDLIPTEADNAIELDQVLGEVFISDVFMGKLPLNEQNEYMNTKVFSNLSQSNLNQSVDADSIEEVMSVDIQSPEEDHIYRGYQKDEGIVVSEIQLNFEEHLECVGENMVNEDVLMPPILPKQTIYSSHKPVYRNLYKCIQPASSKLKDITIKRSTERVNILVDLIPKLIDQVGK